MSIISCPKCGFEQPNGEECRSCGVIFAKYRPYPPVEESQFGETISGKDGAEGGWRYYFRVLRRVSLLITVLVLGLLLWPASPPEVKIDAGTVVRASVKMRDMSAAIRAGRGGTLELSESEVNAWLQTNLDLPAKRKGIRGAEPASNSAAPPHGNSAEPLGKAELNEVQSTISDVRVALTGDRARTHVSFSLYGKAMTFQLEGQLRVENGYLKLLPTAGKIGVLPIPAITLRKAADRLFNSPENREKFRLPDAIEDLRVVDSQLRVSVKRRR